MLSWFRIINEIFQTWSHTVAWARALKQIADVTRGCCVIRHVDVTTAAAWRHGVSLAFQETFRSLVRSHRVVTVTVRRSHNRNLCGVRSCDICIKVMWHEKRYLQTKLVVLVGKWFPHIHLTLTQQGEITSEWEISMSVCVPGCTEKPRSSISGVSSGSCSRIWSKHAQTAFQNSTIYLKWSLYKMSLAPFGWDWSALPVDRNFLRHQLYLNWLEISCYELAHLYEIWKNT